MVNVASKCDQIMVNMSAKCGQKCGQSVVKSVVTSRQTPTVVKTPMVIHPRVKPSYGQSTLPEYPFARMESCPNGHLSEWTLARMDSSPNATMGGKSKVYHTKCLAESIYDISEFTQL